MSYDRYLSLTEWERVAQLVSLAERIERANEQGEVAELSRPKNTRR